MGQTFTPSLLSIALLGMPLLAQTAAPKLRSVDPANMDLSAKPCEDFYQYANGAWLKNNPIPPEENIWGGFNEVRERTREQLKTILEALVQKKDWPQGSIRQKVGDFYASGMDEAAIEKAGLKPIQGLLKRIEGLKAVKDLPALLGDLHSQGIQGGYGFFVMQDQKDSTRYLAAMNQGGLGLPDRDYYLKTDARSQELRDKYAVHVARMLELMGDKPESAKAAASEILAMETRLAKVCRTRVELRDPNRNYNKMTLGELSKQAPGYDWAGYFKARSVSLTEVNVRQPEFFKEFASSAGSIPVSQWRTYLRWNLVRGLSNSLPKAFADESFEFYGKILTGTPQQQARWKRVQDATSGALSEALGQVYVEKHFSAESKRKMLEIVENLRSALKEKITALDWMSEATKQQAQKKLAAFGVKIGYPDTWRDYSKLMIRRDSYAANILRANAFDIRRNLDRLGKPVDRKEWGMPPQMVNAYYSPTMNEIVFPAAILQTPFFDAAADDACNYGGIGAVIGHEMTHGFDDSGSQYDANGNLKNWWTDADRAAYKARTDLVVKQYDAYKALPDQNVNGKLTLGENISDLGGLKVAHAAWKLSLKGKAQPKPIDGFTPEQRFFLNWAVVWRNNIREEALRVRLNTGPHSPGNFRVLGPLSNLPEFYEAFGCGEGSPMVRPIADRPSIW